MRAGAADTRAISEGRWSSTRGESSSRARLGEGGSGAGNGHAPQYWQVAARRHGQLTPVKTVVSSTASKKVVIECDQVRVRGLDIAGVADC